MKKWFFIYTALLVMSGCTDKVLLERVAKLESDRANSATELSSAKYEISDLQTRLGQIESDFSTYKIVNDNSIGYFSPGSSGFSRIDTPNGFFLVSVKRLTPYADGHKITLSIGNPLAASYKDIKVKIRWGKRYNRAFGKYSDWEKTFHETEETILGRTAAGAWNDRTIVLSPSSPEEIGDIRVSLDTNTVSLLSH